MSFGKEYEFLEEVVRESKFAEGISKRNAEILQSFDFRYVKRNHWASDFNRCRKSLWYMWKGEEQKTLANMISPDRMKEGKDIENTVIEKTKRDGIFVTANVPTLITRKKPSYDISGKIDIVTFDPDNLLTKEMVIVEVKSSKDFGERQNFHQWKRYLPSLEHIAQLSCYLDAVKKMRNSVIVKGELWYVNINRMVEQSYEVQRSPEMMIKIHEFFDQIEKDIKKKSPPEVSYRQKGYPCSWYSKDPKRRGLVGMCPYYHKCWGLDE